MSRNLERQMRLGTMTSRRALMEREKAMEAARNPGFSKFGDCLVSINSKNDKVLTSNLRKINSEIRRMQLQINHKMKYFVKNSTVLNHDPLILVERPPSPEVRKRALIMAHYECDDDVPGDENKPGYMKQIRSKARTPSTLTTIDAFTVKQRKKKNVWEGVVNEKSGPEFQSTIRPYAKLTRREKTDLQKGYEFHKPKLDLEHTGQSDTEEASSNKHRPNKKKAKEISAGDSEESDFEDDVTPFITQMAKVRKRSKERKEKTIAEISLRPKTPVHAGSPASLTAPVERAVRFKSPVALSAPKERRAHRKLKTSETKVTY